MERLAQARHRDPGAAWNPVGGMTDPFGRLMGFAVGDPALLPSPYDAGWMLNRIADLPTGAETMQPAPSWLRLQLRKRILLALVAR